MNKKYSVNEAIWIAAAVNAFKKYQETDDVQPMDLYLKNTYLKPQEIESLRKNKFGFIPAEECLNKGICDWVMTPQGTLIKGKTVKSK